MIGNAEIFGWGVAGAAIGYVVVYVRPMLPLLFRANVRRPVINYWNIGGLIIVGSVLISCGGLIALAFNNATESTHALFYGIGWESLVKSGSQAISDRR